MAVAWEIRQGDCLEVLPGLQSESVSLVLTDPPYGWSFMGRSWDKALPNPAVWRECLRLLKPGGFALVMAGARSDCLWRLCRDLEEAGFDLALSQIHWVYRSGFPKPLRLLSYLLHLACPKETPDGKPGLILDPFVGSGTTCVAAIQGGWSSLGIELDEGYVEIARARCAAAEAQVAAAPLRLPVEA